MKDQLSDSRYSSHCSYVLSFIHIINGYLFRYAPISFLEREILVLIITKEREKTLWKELRFINKMGQFFYFTRRKRINVGKWIGFYTFPLLHKSTKRITLTGKRVLFDFTLRS